jgi:hypothetical protein
MSGATTGLTGLALSTVSAAALFYDLHLMFRYCGYGKEL